MYLHRILGFSEDNIYTNVQHIFEVCDDTRFHEEIRMLSLWIMWFYGRTGMFLSLKGDFSQ